MGFGLSYWYVVRYISNDKQSITAAIFNQGSAILIGVTILTFASDAFVNQFVNFDASHKEYFRMAMPWQIFLGSFYMTIVVLI
ncbi:MAG: hypothetical protein RIB63_17740, partial [Fulvivirga sp.]